MYMPKSKKNKKKLSVYFSLPVVVDYILEDTDWLDEDMRDN